MRGKKNEIKCDYNKLQAEFKRRGITNAEAAELLGYANTMFYPSKMANGISRPVQIALKSVLGISQEDYAPDEETKTEKVDDMPVTQEIDAKTVFKSIEEDLYKIMYKAVYDAIKQAWSE